jgi:hypothetical protein
LSSTELIQKEEAADEDGEGNPEVEVGGNYAEKVAWSGEVGRGRQYFNLQNTVRESGVPS